MDLQLFFLFFKSIAYVFLFVNYFNSFCITDEEYDGCDEYDGLRSVAKFATAVFFFQTTRIVVHNFIGVSSGDVIL